MHKYAYVDHTPRPMPYTTAMMIHAHIPAPSRQGSGHRLCVREHHDLPVDFITLLCLGDVAANEAAGFETHRPPQLWTKRFQSHLK